MVVSASNKAGPMRARFLPVSLLLVGCGLLVGVGSCLTWMTVNEADDPPLVLDRSRGLTDFGYMDIRPIGLGAASLVAGLLILMSGLFLGRGVRLLIVAGVASTAAVLVSGLAAILIVVHNHSGPSGSHAIAWRIGDGLALTLAAATLAALTSAGLTLTARHKAHPPTP